MDTSSLPGVPAKPSIEKMNSATIKEITDFIIYVGLKFVFQM
jgi:hypothetical protein